MNDEDRMQEQHRSEPEPPPRERNDPNPAETTEAAGTPDAVKDAESRKAAKDKLARVRGRGVDWVRPTDLIAQGGGTLSRRGIDRTAEMNRHVRAPIEKGARWVAERAKRLPPLSAFGRRGGAEQGPRRSGVGMK
ncbi:hypothetical protein CVS54_01420 [Microbacterium oxydans]|uniref:Uncharacterized protein n=1 Tax=Microbacterium oxydans TaxID=82380 RepID=A0A3S9WJP6_9MICO|nr:hypothetical protein [Microbacterium oxydans]AZS40097.1 hypothetical protein CVS54_01420 [Microbacterium oxydans]